MTNTLVKAKALYDAGVYVNPVLPPAAPQEGCILRTSYMATHTEAILDEAMDIIKRGIGGKIAMDKIKVVLLTGGSKGIGYRDGEKLRRRRAAKIYELSRHEAANPGVVHIAGTSQILLPLKRPVQTVIGREGRIDVLVCNAGTILSRCRRVHRRGPRSES